MKNAKILLLLVLFGGLFMLVIIPSVNAIINRTIDLFDIPELDNISNRIADNGQKWGVVTISDNRYSINNSILQAKYGRHTVDYPLSSHAEINFSSHLRADGDFVKFDWKQNTTGAEVGIIYLLNQADIVFPIMWSGMTSNTCFRNTTTSGTGETDCAVGNNPQNTIYNAGDDPPSLDYFNFTLYLNFTNGTIRIEMNEAQTNTLRIFNRSLWKNFSSVSGIWIGISPDDEGGSTSYYNNIVTGFENILPNTTNVSITELPIIVGNNLKGHANYSDLNNDVAGGNQTYWWVNKTLILDANNSFVLLGGNVTDDANITFSARFNDTFEWSDWVNSSNVNVGDSTNPTLNNCTLSSNSITDASGNKINLTCDATDVRSNIQTMVASLNGTINKTLTFSFTQSLNVISTYVIFESAETLKVGSYSINQVNVTDTSSNKLSNSTNDLHFEVTSAPSSNGGGTTGGGGGGLTPKPVQNITIVQPERCGNFVCESCVDTNISNCLDETPLSCPQDCKLFSLDNTFCTPIFNCGNWLTSWFINWMLLLAVGGLIVTQYTADKKKKRL